jgi:hypothetical protein
MRTGMRRSTMVAVIAVWLLLMTFPVVAFVMANSGQVQIGNIEGSHLRIFLLREMDSEGIGLEWARRDAEHTTCIKTTVRYLVWGGHREATNVNYCRCREPSTGAVETLPACDLR